MNPESLLETTKALKEQLKKVPVTFEVNQFIKETQDAIEAINQKNWLTGSGYIAPHFPLFNEKMEGLEPGLYLFAGESNSGKTAVMSNLFWDYVLHTSNELYGLYFSLDDSKSEIYPRIIAMTQKIPIGCIKKPSVYQEKAKKPEFDYYNEYLSKRAIGYEMLKEQSSHVSVLDASDPCCNNEEEIYAFIKNFKEALKKDRPNANILIAIDAIDDIRLKDITENVAEEIAKIVKKWAIHLDIPIFCTKHLKKINANRRPILDDLRDSNTLVYEASTVFLVFNDVSKNKGQAKIFYIEEDPENKHPVIELDWAKNKKSSYKGVTFSHFIPDFSAVMECNESTGKHYERSLYTL